MNPTHYNTCNKIGNEFTKGLKIHVMTVWLSYKSAAHSVVYLCDHIVCDVFIVALRKLRYSRWRPEFNESVEICTSNHLGSTIMYKFQMYNSETREFNHVI